MKTSWLLSLVLAAIAPQAIAQATGFPERPVRVVVPFAPGSGADALARYYAGRLAADLGQPFVVENRAGAGAVIGVMAVKQAPADGYTILLATNSPLSVNPLTMKDLPYDPAKDLKPIGGLSRSMNALAVPGNSRFKTFADMVAAAKATTPLLTGATYTPGYRIATEWLASAAGFKFTHVPYKDISPVFSDLAGGQIDFALVDSTGLSATMAKSGKIRWLAVAGEQRHPEFPDVPTMRELGFRDYVNYGWSAFYIRAETPADITRKLADALQKALNTEEARENSRKMGGEQMPFPPEVMAKYQRDEFERYQRVAQGAGIRPQ